MPRFNEIINNFINGEVSPKLYGRSDSEIYKRSARNILNKIVHPQGGASRRLGSVLEIDQLLEDSLVAHNISANSRCVPFTYSKDEGYLLIFPADSSFGNYKVILYDPANRTLIPVFLNGGVSAGWTGDSVGGGSVSANTLTDNETVSEIQYAQNGALIVFTHQDFPPFALVRLSRGSFVCYDYHRAGLFVPSGGASGWQSWPYMDLNTTAVTMTASATAIGAATLTASAASFTADDVGTYIMVTNSGTTGAALISAFTSTTVVDITIEKVFPGTSAYTTWAKSAWSKTRGYPRSVCFTPDQRILFGFNKSEPEKMWASQQGDVYELANHDTLTPGTTLTADDPVSFSAFSTEANEGLWLRGGTRNVLAGTRGREYAISEISGTRIPPAQVQPQTSYGSEAVQPALVDDVPVFVQRGFRKLREMIFDYRVEGYASIDVTFYAEHIFKKSQEVLGDLNVSKIKQLAYQALDNNILWAIDTNGYLYGCTKSRENEVTAFHRHELGGSSAGEYPRVNSICAIPSNNGTGDDLYLVVTRTINGSSKTYIEKIGSEFRGTTLHSDAETRENQPVFMDCAKIFRPRSSNFWARLFANGTATDADGSTTVTTVGSWTYDGWAYSTANTSHLSWDGTSNADFAQVGCVEFEFACQVSQFTNTATLLNISQAAASQNNAIEVEYTIAGNILLTVRDSTGTAFINGVTVGNVGTTVNGVSGFLRTFHFELNYDFTAGATRVFINGKQCGATIATTGTRTTAIDLIRLNGDEAGNQSRDLIKYRNFRIFNAVQHTADFEVFEPNEESTTLRGLNYLEGQTVQVLADGLYLSGTYTVTSGVITLPAATYSTILVGLGYEHYIEIQAVDAGTGIGSAQGSIKRIDRVVVRFNASAQGQVGPDLDNLLEQQFRLAATPITDPIVLVTDDKPIDFNGDYDRQARVVIYGDAPLPCNVTCVVLRGVTADV